MGQIRITNAENTCVVVEAADAKKPRQVVLKVTAGECTESENSLWYVTENDQISSVLFPNTCMQMSKDRKMIELDECNASKKQLVDYMDGRLHLGNRCVFGIIKKENSERKVVMRLGKCGYGLFGNSERFGQEFGDESSDEGSDEIERV